MKGMQLLSKQKEENRFHQFEQMFRCGIKTHEQIKYWHKRDACGFGNVFLLFHILCWSVKQMCCCLCRKKKQQLTHVLDKSGLTLLPNFSV